MFYSIASTNPSSASQVIGITSAAAASSSALLSDSLYFGGANARGGASKIVTSFIDSEKFGEELGSNSGSVSIAEGADAGGLILSGSFGSSRRPERVADFI